MTTPHPEFYPDVAGDHRWRLRAANHEIQAHGEGHGSERDAIRAWVDVVESVLTWVHENADGTDHASLTAAATKHARGEA